MSKEAMKLALEALENYPAIGLAISGADAWNQCQKAITVLREALAEQPAQQEPDETKCPECGYLTKHTEHIGCLRKQLNAINAFEQRNFAIVNMDKFPPAQRKPQFKEFIKWANGAGYDCANTCNSDAGEWICLNPMTHDLWRAWQAANNIKEQP